MAVAAYESMPELSGFLHSVRSGLQDFADRFREEALLQTTRELAGTVAAVEDLSRTVEQLQVIGAHALQRQNIAVAGETDRRFPWADPAPDRRDGRARRTGFRDTAEYLRARLRISRSEANRRLRLGAATLPSALMTGEEAPPKLATLGAAVAGSRISGQAATLIHDAVERVRPAAKP
ncbi:DUF222 domain-containing protein, partial [Arthrobacter deserti]|nr:DUF222 domain-containing protein [Arthrobacter deserti]